MANGHDKNKKAPSIQRPAAPELIPLSQIYFKLDWNGRDASRYAANGVGGGKEGSDADPALFAEGLAVDGQKTPIDVRLNPWPKESKATYAAVTGFRRGAGIALAVGAFESANAKADPKDRRAPRNSVESGLVIAFVHEEMTEEQAVVLNALENMDRLNLVSADMAFNVWRIADAFGKDNISHKEIGRMVGRSQPVITDLMTIREKVKPEIRLAWRQGGEPRSELNPMGVSLSVENMLKVAAAEGDGQAEFFKKLCETVGTAKKGGPGRGNWLDGAKKEAAAIGAMLGNLERERFINGDLFDWHGMLFGTGPVKAGPVNVKWHKDVSEKSETGGLTTRATEFRAILALAATDAYHAARIVKTDEQVKAELQAAKAAPPAANSQPVLS